MAAVRAFDEAARTGARAWKLEGAIDLIFARNPRGVEPAGPFQVWDGEALVPIDSYLAANPRPDLVNLEERLEALEVGRYGHRSGDVMLLSRYRKKGPVTDRFYFSAFYRSWHGSPSRQDSEILFALARPASTGPKLRAQMHAAIGETPSQLDVTPLILALLGRWRPAAGEIYDLHGTGAAGLPTKPRQVHFTRPASWFFLCFFRNGALRERAATQMIVGHGSMPR